MSEIIQQKQAFDIGSEDLGNSDPRCPTVLLLDVSGSMSGQAIQELQAGVVQYIDELAADALARRRVEIAIVTFGGTVQVAHRFATADKFVTPTLTATSDTPMGQAIVAALDLLKERKVELSRLGLPQFRAWVFLITDGGPTDDRLAAWNEAVQRIRDGEQRQSFLFFAVGVKGANMEKLKELCVDRPPVTLDGLRFRDLFQWLSASQKEIAKSQPGQSVPLQPIGWGSVTA
jgi:uncharacterized protein YegL